MWGEGDEGLLEPQQGDELKGSKGVLVEGGQEEEGEEDMANAAFQVQSSGEEAIRDRSYIPYVTPQVIPYVTPLPRKHKKTWGRSKEGVVTGGIW